MSNAYRRNLDSAALRYARSAPNPAMGRETLARVTMAANGIGSQFSWHAAECRADLLSVADRLTRIVATPDGCPADWIRHAAQLESRIHALIGFHDSCRA